MPAADADRRGLDDVLTTVAFLAALVAPACGVALRGGAPAVDASEKREPAAWPRFGTAPPVAWARGVTAWFRDRVPWRHAAVGAHHRARLALGATRVGEVLVGARGSLYFADDDSLESLTGVPERPPAVAAAWAERIDARRRWVEAETGAPYVFLLAPDKHDVLVEDLPTAWRDARRGRRADAILAALRARGVRAHDPRPAMRAAGARGVRPYPRTDSHWSHEGAALAARGALALVAAELPGPWSEALERAPRRRRHEPRGQDLAQLLGLTDLLPEGEVVELTPPPAPPAGAPRVVVLGDSFTEALAIALRAAGLEVIVGHPIQLALVPGLRPALVIEERAQRRLSGEQVLLPPPPGATPPR